jgi:hypothetical protein
MGERSLSPLNVHGKLPLVLVLIIFWVSSWNIKKENTFHQPTCQEHQQCQIVIRDTVTRKSGLMDCTLAIIKWISNCSGNESRTIEKPQQWDPCDSQILGSSSILWLIWRKLYSCVLVKNQFLFKTNNSTKNLANLQLRFCPAKWSDLSPLSASLPSSLSV